MTHLRIKGFKFNDFRIKEIWRYRLQLNAWFQALQLKALELNDSEFKATKYCFCENSTFAIIATHHNILRFLYSW